MRNADRSFPAIIGGRTVPTDKTTASLCPAQPDLVVGRVAACTRDHVDQAVAAARKAFAGLGLHRRGAAGGETGAAWPS